MAIKTTSPIAPYWYTPVAEAESSNPTKFHVRPLNAFEKQDVDFRQNGNSWSTNADSAKKVLGYAVIGWENVLDDKGEPIQFNQNNKLDVLGKLPHDVLFDVFCEVFLKSTLSEDQRKN